MESEDAVGLSADEVQAVYALLAAREPADPVLRRLLARLESSLYRNMTIEQIEKLRAGGAGASGARTGQGRG